MGGLSPHCKKHGRDYVHLYKNGQGEFCPTLYRKSSFRQETLRCQPVLKTPRRQFQGTTILQDWTTGHWCCIHGTNTKLLMPLYILQYNRRRRMSTPKVGGETWWCVCRHFCGAYWDTHTNIAWDVKRNFKSSYRNATSNWNVQVVFVSSLFMTFILLPCCFGEPLSDVTLWMRMCGKYRYLTTRFDFPPKWATFLRHFLFYLFILLENFQSYDEK